MEKEGKSKKRVLIEIWGVTIGMLMVQIIATGLQLLSKVILNHGTYVFAFMAYRNVIGAIFIAPFALYYERGSGKKVTWLAAFWLFAVALTGVSLAMGLFYYGLADTTATYATNFLNLVPIVTFIFSAIFRLEKLHLKTKVGKIKTACAMVCFGGVVIIALYKGMSFHISHHILHLPQHLNNSQHHWTRGTVFLVCSCLSYGLWFIAQAKLLKVFPYKFWATFYVCIFATLQQVVIGLCINRSKAAWKLEWNLQLLTIVYAGVLATAATFWLICWAVTKRGPTYPSMFNPLTLIFVAIAETLFLGQDISVGSLIGMSVIILGLYGFLWAKNTEFKRTALLLTITTSANGQDMVSESMNPPQSAATVVPESLVTNNTGH